MTCIRPGGPATRLTAGQKSLPHVLRMTIRVCTMPQTVKHRPRSSGDVCGDAVHRHQGSSWRSYLSTRHHSDPLSAWTSPLRSPGVPLNAPRPPLSTPLLYRQTPLESTNPRDEGALTSCHRSRGGSPKRHENGPLQAVCCHESSLANPRSVRDNSLAHAFPLRGFRWLGWSRYRLGKRGRGRWTSIGYPTKKLSLIGRGRALAQGRVWPP